VLEDHLAKRKAGSLDEDLAENFAEDVVLLTSHGLLRGHESVRRLARQLAADFPDNGFEYRNVLLEGELGFLEWSATSERARVRDGADSYLIRDGKIVAQTIHHSVETGGDE
jgi:hypothetical protein